MTSVLCSKAVSWVEERTGWRLLFNLLLRILEAIEMPMVPPKKRNWIMAPVATAGEEMWLILRFDTKRSRRQVSKAYRDL